MAIIDTLLRKGATLIRGKNYSLTTQLMKNTGTKVYHVFDRAGNLVNKTVLPGAGNKRAVASSISTNFLQGKAIQSTNRQGEFALTFANKASTNSLARTDFFRPGDIGYTRSIGAVNSVITSVSPHGTEVVKLTGKNGELLNKIVFPSKSGPRDYITSISSNYVQGKPIQSTINQGEFARTFANEASTNSLKRSDFFRPGDLS